MQTMNTPKDVARDVATKIGYPGYNSLGGSTLSTTASLAKGRKIQDLPQAWTKWLVKKGTGHAAVEKRTVYYGLCQEQHILQDEIMYDLEGGFEKKNIMIVPNNQKDMGNRFKLLQKDVRQEVEYRIGGNDNKISRR